MFYRLCLLLCLTLSTLSNVIRPDHPKYDALKRALHEDSFKHFYWTKLLCSADTTIVYPCDGHESHKGMSNEPLPVLIACIVFQNTSCALHLIGMMEQAYPEALDITDAQKRTALMHAVIANNLPVFCALIECAKGHYYAFQKDTGTWPTKIKVDIHAVDQNGQTALDLAIQHKRIPMIRQLILNGATVTPQLLEPLEHIYDPSIEDQKTFKAHAKSRQDVLGQPVQQAELTKLIALQQYENSNNVLTEGHPLYDPVAQAILRGDTETLSHLCVYNSDEFHRLSWIRYPQPINSNRPFNDPLPLISACIANNNTQCALFFTQIGHLNEPDNDGHTPLYYAVIYDNLPVFNELCKKRATVQAADKETLMDIAIQKKLYYMAYTLYTSNHSYTMSTTSQARLKAYLDGQDDKKTSRIIDPRKNEYAERLFALIN